MKKIVLPENLGLGPIYMGNYPISLITMNWYQNCHINHHQHHAYWKLGPTEAVICPSHVIN